MTETEGLTCNDWRPMIDFLGGKISPRKAILYLAGGLRCIWDLLYDDASRAAVEMAERAADGQGTQQEIWQTRYSAETPTFGSDFDPGFLRQYFSDGKYDPGVRRLLEMGVFTEADIRGTDIAQHEHLGDSATFKRLHNAACIAYLCLNLISENRLHPHTVQRLSGLSEWPGDWLVRELFGNPFQSFSLRSECLNWNRNTVPILAHKIYDNRAFECMPILADALEEAGCEETSILNHCRDGNHHVLGCWVLDSLLGLNEIVLSPANFTHQIVPRGHDASE